MDFIHFFLFLLALLTFLLTLNKRILRSTPKTPSPKLPPGPWKLPIIGSLHHLRGGTPHHSLRSLAKKHGPALMHLQLGQVSMVVVSEPEPAEEILKTHDLSFAQRPSMLSFDIVVYKSSDLSFSPFGKYWRTLRKICVLELLTAKRIESFNFIREEEVMSMIQSISQSCGQPINLTQRIYTLAADIISRVAFGARNEEKERFLACVKEFIHLSNGFSVSDLFPSWKLLPVVTGLRSKLEKLHLKLDRIITDIIDEHKEKSMNLKSDQHAPEEDLVDVLLKIQQDDGLDVPITMDSVKAIILDMFTGGADTSSTLLEWTMAELMRHPPIMAKVQEEVRRVIGREERFCETDIKELKYMKLVLMETLRLHPPVCLLIRESRESCKIGGYDIPSKTKIIINSWALARDLRLWGDDAEIFNPERFLCGSIDYRGAHFEYLPFGAGRRMCPGMLFAMVNVELPLAKLLYYFDWKLPHDMKPQDLDMTELCGGSVGRRSALDLVPIPHFPAPC